MVPQAKFCIQPKKNLTFVAAVVAEIFGHLTLQYVILPVKTSFNSPDRSIVLVYVVESFILFVRKLYLFLSMANLQVSLLKINNVLYFQRQFPNLI